MPALTKNTLTPQVDLPLWEWTRFAPAVSSGVSSACSADNPDFLQAEHGRYIYYLLSAAQFVRYDTVTDMYQQLSSPAASPVSFSTMKMSGAYGPEGNVLGATSNTLTVPAVTQQSLVGYDVSIVSGTGAGQRRTITGAAEPVVAELGVVSAVNNVLGALTLTDGTKAWIVNQFAGQSVRITGNAGVGQVRRILSNSSTVLTLGDTTQMNKPWHNPAIFSPAVSATAGSQSAYQIESQVLTVDTAWTVTPDSTSVFRVASGMIMLGSNIGAAPFFTLQAWDCITDTWYILPAQSGVLASGITDLSIERTTENASIWARGTVTAHTGTSITDGTHGVDAASWRTNQWAGYWVFIYSGTGAGQIRQISSNTGNTLNWSGAMSPHPGTDSRYMIIGFDAGTATAGAATSITDSTKAWEVNRWRNYVVRILAGTGAGQYRPIASNTATALTVLTPWATNPDSTSVYVIQGDPDKLYLFAGGHGSIPIHNLDSNVTTFGRQVDWGIARNGSATVAGHQPVAIASLANATTTATVTTAHAHQFKVGDLVTVRGATDANFNVTNVVIASVPLATTFTYVMAGTPASTTLVSAQTTSILVDLSKNWTVNEHAGRTVHLYTTAITASNGGVTGQAVRIASNTANTLTFVVASTAATNGVSRYSIATSTAIGAIDQGVATGTQSATQLQDTTKVGTFTVANTINSTLITVNTVTSGQLYVGHAVSGTGIPTGAVIARFGTGTGGTGTYFLSVNCTSTNASFTMTSGWAVNAYAGKRLRYLGTNGPIEVAITSNTNNTLTFGSTTSPLTGQTGYAIVEGTVRGAGTVANWAFGTSDASQRGRYVYVTRGNGFIGFDRVDLAADRVSLMTTIPLTESLSTGTMAAYDGVDRIYFHKDATQRVFSLDVVTGKVNGASIYPYAAPTAVLGNRMEVFTTKDGLKYLWLNRASFQECFRCLLFW
jgi:hypothetical protein